MKPSRLILATGLTAILASACTQGPQRARQIAMIDRALVAAPGAAQPSTVVKTEVAYARAAKESGLYSASAAYAAPGAILHTKLGGREAAPILAKLDDPDETIDWGPRTVVMSCDGTLALSLGRFKDREGFVGNYVTAWERQPDNTYKWTYDVAGRDDPQPPPRKQFEDGDIVVTAIDSVEGLVATCPRADSPVPLPPVDSAVGLRAVDAKTSPDGTLRWRWQHRGPDEKFVAAEYYYNGRWVTAIEETLASPPDERTGVPEID